jgi:hypothetical protein
MVSHTSGLRLGQRPGSHLLVRRQCAAWTAESRIDSLTDRPIPGEVVGAEVARHLPPRACNRSQPARSFVGGITNGYSTRGFGARVYSNKHRPAAGRSACSRAARTAAPWRTCWLTLLAQWTLRGTIDYPKSYPRAIYAGLIEVLFSYNKLISFAFCSIDPTFLPITGEHLSPPADTLGGKNRPVRDVGPLNLLRCTSGAAPECDSVSSPAFGPECEAPRATEIHRTSRWRGGSLALAARAQPAAGTLRLCILERIPVDFTHSLRA